MRSIAGRRTALALAGAVAAAFAAPAFSAKPPDPKPAPFAPPPSGTLAVCNTSGPRPVTGTFTYTLATLASAGGTQTLNVPVGTCTGQVFYPKGATVTVTETVPPGDTVAAISIAGGESSIASTNLAAGSVTVTIGLGQSTLTFQTNAPLPRCVVPNVLGFTLTTAGTSLKKHSCRVGAVHKTYSKTVRPGRVTSESPRRGSTLVYNAPVALVLSRGPRP
jgi:eukaryotic-like serine/threonine-protein kinase